jgi:hypothetical protein
VQWTERAEGVVGFAWAAEVNNPNPVEVDAAVTLCLRDASGAVIHEVQERVVVPSGEVVACTAAGQMEESVALRAATWTFDVAALESGSGEGLGGGKEAAEPRVASGVTGGAATAGAIEEPVPLTPDMVPPQLIAESVQIDIQDPELQDLNVSGKQISMRCLVQSDGTVGAARVLKIDPPLALKAASDALARSVERSAVMYWRFEPAMRAGVPLPVWYTLTIRYEPAG